MGAWTIAVLLGLLVAYPAAAAEKLGIPTEGQSFRDWISAEMVRQDWPVEAITGQARVIDGDTIEVAGQRIRLFGIDAPERAQRCHAEAVGWAKEGPEYQCGRDASASLAVILGQQSVSCEKRDTDRYGRTVATCSTEAGDIGAEMVRQGWAVDYSHYSHGRYAAEETEARNAKRGIWSGRFEMPEDWRRQHKTGK